MASAERVESQERGSLLDSPSADTARRGLRSGVSMLIVGMLLTVSANSSVRGRGFLQSHPPRRLLSSDLQATCGITEKDTDFKTREDLAPISGVPSADACNNHCKGLERCGAWAWGEALGVPGVSHVCFPKVLAEGELPQKIAKSGITGGVLCPDALAVAPVQEEAKAKCPQLEGVDFGTQASLSSLSKVGSAQICQAACRAAPGCEAWTWGQVRNSPGLTDRCFLKKLSAGEKPQHIPKAGVISGFACGASPPGQKEEAPAKGKGKDEEAKEESTLAVKVLPTPQEEDPPKNKAPQQEAPGSSLLYCFTFTMPRGLQSGLLQRQHELGVGLFMCDDFVVYSNQSFGEETKLKVSIVPTIVANTHEESEGPLSRGIYRAVWQQVLSDGTFWLYDWTTKVEPDTVFFPDRLRPILKGYAGELETHQHGLYLNNCRFGMQGAMEVFSSAAVQALGDGWQHCEHHFGRLGSVNSLWGENLFVDQCLSEVFSVRREYNSGLLVDEGCQPPQAWHRCQEDAVAFHPLRSQESFMLCLQHDEQVSKSLVFK